MNDIEKEKFHDDTVEKDIYLGKIEGIGKNKKNKDVDLGKIEKDDIQKEKLDLGQIDK